MRILMRVVMRSPWLPILLTSAIMAGCSASSAIKPAETLDERTGMTVGTLQSPIEFVQTLGLTAQVAGKRTSFAYLGPVEWDRMGHISYGLWIHVAPGNDRQIADLHSPGAVTLILDDGPVVLTYIDPPEPGASPYRTVASWGQAAYFELNEDLLKHLATSQKLDMEFRAQDDSTVVFLPTQNTRATLTEYARARGINVD